MTIQSIYAVINSAQTLRVLFPFVFQVNWRKNKKYVHNAMLINERELLIGWENQWVTHIEWSPLLIILMI